MLMLALVAMAGNRRVDVDFGPGWMWPVPSMRIGGILYDAVISDGFGSPRPNNRIHAGVDICYQRRSRTDLVGVYAPGTHDGTPGFFAPRLTPIVAAHDGTLWDCRKTERGYAVTVAHDGTPFTTFYQHLETPAVPLVQPRRLGNGQLATPVSSTTGQPFKVTQGMPLGFMGWDPLDGARSVRHLHFEVWFRGTSRNAIDPAPGMRSWVRPSFLFQP